MAKEKQNGQAQAAYVPPSYDETKEAGVLPEADWHDASLARMWDTVSKNSGNPQLVGIFVIDNGDAVGQQLREYFPLGLPTQFGEAKLKSLGVKSGFRWEGGIPLDDFALQFVDFDEPLRISIKVRHEYAIKSTSGGWKNNVPKEEYDAWTGDRSIKPAIARYGVVKNDPDLQVECAYGDPSIEFPPKGEETEEAEDWMEEEEEDDFSFEPDDDLPF